MVSRYAPFAFQFWTSPEILRIVSDLAGVALIPVMDHEICHTNVQLGPEGLQGIENTPVDPPGPPPGYQQKQRGDDGVTASAIVPWHRDSYPFVCFVMLSDTSAMTGGETEIRKGDGTTVKKKCPKMVEYPSPVQVKWASG
jgi:hypothetical protein